MPESGSLSLRACVCTYRAGRQAVTCLRSPGPVPRLHRLPKLSSASCRRPFAFPTVGHRQSAQTVVHHRRAFVLIFLENNKNFGSSWLNFHSHHFTIHQPPFACLRNGRSIYISIDIGLKCPRPAGAIYRIATIVVLIAFSVVVAVAAAAAATAAATLQTTSHSKVVHSH